MASKRVIGIVKRVSLAEFSEGWDDCYARMRPVTYDEQLEIMELDFDKMGKRETLDYQFQVVKDHFIDGKIKAKDPETGEMKLVDMEPEDAKATMLIVAKLFREIIGLNLSPKETAPAESSNPTN